MLESMLAEQMGAFPRSLDRLHSNVYSLVWHFAVSVSVFEAS